MTSSISRTEARESRWFIYRKKPPAPPPPGPGSNRRTPWAGSLDEVIATVRDRPRSRGGLRPWSKNYLHENSAGSPERDEATNLPDLEKSDQRGRAEVFRLRMRSCTVSCIRLVPPL